MLEELLSRYPSLTACREDIAQASQMLIDCYRRGGKLLTPSPLLCTDNAAMTAYAGWLLGRAGFQHDLSMETIPRGRAVPDDMVCRAEHPQSGETA